MFVGNVWLMESAIKKTLQEVLSDMKNDFMQIKQFIGAAIGKYPNVKLLLPIEEYREINKYINSGEAKPELFYEPPKYYDDEDEFSEELNNA